MTWAWPEILIISQSYFRPDFLTKRTQEGGGALRRERGRKEWDRGKERKKERDKGREKERKKERKRRIKERKRRIKERGEEKRREGRIEER